MLIDPSDPKYHLRVRGLVAQHEDLFNTINILHHGMRTGQARDVLSLVFIRLSDYARYHFLYEEDLMERYRYPGLTHHRQEHEFFTARVRELGSQFLEGTRPPTFEIMEFLRNWLSNHILTTDKAFDHFMVKVQAESPDQILYR